VFVPLYDINPLRRISFQYANLGLIILNVLVFLIFQLRNGTAGNECVEALFSKTFGLIPLELLGTPVSFPGCPATEALVSPVAEPITLLTYMFLHGDIFHLAGNMLFLWVFGDNVEDAMGHFRYIAFYLLCGIVGGLMHVALAGGLMPGVLGTEATAPLIGASGAVSGVVVAYLLLHPRVHLWVLVLRIIPLRIQAFWALGAWIGMNLTFAFLQIEPTVAWWAHVGGMLAGGLLVLVLRRRGVDLFQEPPNETA
jgi:membrane associated rhomboid family serine protease